MTTGRTRQAQPFDQERLFADQSESVEVWHREVGHDDICLVFRRQASAIPPSHTNRASYPAFLSNSPIMR